MEKSFKLNMVSMPNFLSFQMPPRPRQEGFNPAPQLDVKDLSRQEAEQYAEEMRKAFIAHWESKQKTFTDEEAKQTIAK